MHCNAASTLSAKHFYNQVHRGFGGECVACVSSIYMTGLSALVKPGITLRVKHVSRAVCPATQAGFALWRFPLASGKIPMPQSEGSLCESW
jgi:hypothetical protein